MTIYMECLIPGHGFLYDVGDNGVCLECWEQKHRYRFPVTRELECVPFVLGTVSARLEYRPFTFREMG